MVACAKLVEGMSRVGCSQHRVSERYESEGAVKRYQSPSTVGEGAIGPIEGSLRFLYWFLTSAGTATQCGYRGEHTRVDGHELPLCSIRREQGRDKKLAEPMQKKGVVRRSTE